MLIGLDLGAYYKFYISNNNNVMGDPSNDELKRLLTLHASGTHVTGS